MSVDKFGHFSSGNNSKELAIVSDGNTINAHFKRIKNLRDPILKKDAATKSFVINSLDDYKNSSEIKIASLKSSYESKFSEIETKFKQINEDVESEFRNFNTRIESIKKSLDTLINVLYNQKINIGEHILTFDNQQGSYKISK